MGHRSGVELSPELLKDFYRYARNQGYVDARLAWSLRDLVRRWLATDWPRGRFEVETLYPAEAGDLISNIEQYIRSQWGRKAGKTRARSRSSRQRQLEREQDPIPAKDPRQTSFL